MESASTQSGMQQPAAALVIPEASPERGAAAPESPELQTQGGTEDTAPHEKSNPTIYRGTDEVFRAAPGIAPVRLYGDAVSLNFEQAPLTEVVHAILGDILELDYIVEHPINGQVTLRTKTPVERNQLLQILESLLKANNALMIRDNDGRIFVSASGQMTRLRPSLSSSPESVVGYSTLIVPLQYISAGNMAEILTPMADESAFVRVDNMRNLLMLAGTSGQLQGWQEIIDTFDVDLLKGMSVGIFPIENAPLEDINQALAAMLGNDGANDTAASVTGIGSVIRIIPVPRLSSIMVVTPRAHYLERVKTWIERLDRVPDSNFEPQLHVYPVQNTSSTHLASMLSTIFAGGAGGGGSRSSAAGVAPGLTPESVSSSGGGIAGSGLGTSAGANAGAQSQGASGTRNIAVGSVRIVADEENNSLLVYATGKEYRKIKPALDRLDVPVSQIMIEVSIIEVTLVDRFRYGLEWSFSGGLGGDYSGAGQLVDGEGIASIIPGFSYSVLNGTGEIKAVLNALASDSLVNVISSPSLMVLDNQEASIQVGDEVPVSGGATTIEGGSVVENIIYRQTGVQLSVTPSVNAGGMVTMDIDQSVTDLGPEESTTRQRSFRERKINSRVAVRDGESVVLGGLIRENKTSGNSGLPFLRNVPVVGLLFGSTNTGNDRTELIVVITPRVIFNDEDLRDISRDMRRQMRRLDLIDVSESSSFLGGSRAVQPDAPDSQ